MEPNFHQLLIIIDFQSENRYGLYGSSLKTGMDKYGINHVQSAIIYWS